MGQNLYITNRLVAARMIHTGLLCRTRSFVGLFVGDLSSCELMQANLCH